MDEIIEIQTPKDIDRIKLKQNQLIRLKCCKCGTIKTIKYRAAYKNGIRRMLCSKCLYKDSLIRKYGVDNPAKSEAIKQKICDTNMKRYGARSCLSNQEIRKKGEKTRIEKYNDPHFTNRALCRKTMLKRYGVEFPMQYKEGKQHFESAMIKKYGVKYSAESKELFRKTCDTKKELYGNAFYTNITKTYKTKKKKYGDPYYSNSDKAKQTMLKRYGYSSFLNTPDFKSKSAKRMEELYGSSGPIFNYKYAWNNIFFDSSWEFYFYLYCLNMGIPVIRNTEEFLEYNAGEFFNRRYYPDFKILVNSVWMYVEIKGKHLLNDKQELVSPFRYKASGTAIPESELQKESRINFYKTKCMRDHNVIILSEEEISQMINYICRIYSKYYLSRYRIVSKGYVASDFCTNSMYPRIIQYAYSIHDVESSAKYTKGIYSNNGGTGLIPEDLI